MDQDIVVFNHDKMYPFEIVSENTGYGELGLEGKLGYDKLSVINIWRFQWVISAHANSTLDLNVMETLQVWGFLNGTAKYCQGAEFSVDDRSLGFVNRAFDLVGPIILSKGTHKLEVKAENTGCCHTVWAFAGQSHTFEKPSYYLTMGAICKDENEYLEEWLDHHFAIGFEHFFILDNDSKKPLKETVASSKYAKFVTIENFKTRNNNTQNSAYSYILRKFGPFTKWMGILDIDEFITPKLPIAFAKYMQSFEAFGGLEVPWVMFGNSGLKHRIGLQRKSFFHSYLDPHVKSIVQPKYVSFVPCAHKFEYVANRNAVGEHYDERRTAKYIQINHYWTRSENEWLDKMQRGAIVPGYDRSLEDFKNHQNKCVFQDIEIQKLHDRLLEPTKIYQTIKPIVGFIHVAAVNHWQAILNEQVEKIIRSGLYGASDQIHIGIVGGNEAEVKHKLKDLPSKCRVIYFTRNIRLYEFPTLKLLQDHCRSQDCYVWYIHSKGVVNWREFADLWRARMESLILCFWEFATKKLDSGYSAVGEFGGVEDRWAIPGNFWWASSSHIKTLPSIESLDHANRFECERWIGINGADQIYFLSYGDTIFDAFEIVTQQSSDGRCATNGWHGFRDSKVQYAGELPSHLIATHAPSKIQIRVKKEIAVFGFLCLTGGANSIVEFIINDSSLGFVDLAGGRTAQSRTLLPGCYELAIMIRCPERWGCHTVWGLTLI